MQSIIKLFQTLFHLTVTGLLLCLGYFVRITNRKTQISTGKLLGDLMRILSPKRKKITYRNLKESFPEKSQANLKGILTDSYRNLGITLIELLTLKNMPESKLREIIKYKNIDLIKDCALRGKGLILLSGHYGNWELLAYSAGLFSGIPVTVVIKRQKNKFADRIMNNYRISGGNRIISMRRAAMTIVKSLTKGEAVALLADQSASKDKDIYVDFFGRPAITYEAPAALSLRFGAPIVIGFANRLNDGTYEVELKEIQASDLSYDNEGVKELTRRHVTELENQIRKNPGLWAWQHRRWKHKPKETVNA